MTKEQIIRPADAKEYINFQFQGLVQTLEQFDYPGVANVIRAANAVFNTTSPDKHPPQPDSILLEKSE